MLLSLTPQSLQLPLFRCLRSQTLLSFSLRLLNSRFGSFAGDLVAKLEKEAAEGADAVAEAAEDVSDAAKDAKKTVEPKKTAARKTTARKTTSTAKKSTASA